MAAIKLYPILLLASVLLFLVLFSLAGFLISIRPPKIVSIPTPANLGLEHEDVSFMTQDGLRLSGWFIPSRKTLDNTAEKPKTVILLHGYPADKGDILPALSFLSRDYNLLLFDFRYLGESEGKISTGGAKETEDLLAAIGFLKSQDIAEVGVWGFSMGGAVALMTAKKAPEIKAIVSESSYAHLDLMARELYKIPILRYPLGYLTGLWSRIFLGIIPRNVSPSDSVKDLDIPILIVHSKNDRVIRFEHALLLQEALKDNPKAEFWFSEGSSGEANLSHGQLGADYQIRIAAFFSKAFLALP